MVLHVARTIVINSFFLMRSHLLVFQVLSVLTHSRDTTQEKRKTRSFLFGRRPSLPYGLRLFVRGGKRKLQSQVATGCRDRGNLQTRIGHLAGMVTHMRARHNLLW